VSNTLIVNISVSVFCERLSIEFIINLSQTFCKWSLNNFNFCLSKLILLLNWIVFAKYCNRQMIVLRNFFLVFYKSYLTKKKSLMILLLRLCLSYLIQCYLIFYNSFLYLFLKTLKHSHTVLEILSEFSDIFRDIIIFLFYKIMNFFTNYSLSQNVLNFIFFVRFNRCFSDLKWYDLIVVLKYKCMKY